MNGVVLGTGAGAYLRLLRHGPAAKPFIAAVIARLPISMAPLGMILLIQHERGAYTIAGVVTGAYALGSAVGSPVWGRTMDRRGQPGVVVATSLVCAALLAGLAVAAVKGGGDALLIVLAALAGLSFPPVSPAMRASWRVIFPDAASRRVGFALDATSVEAIFVGGPLLLSLLLALTTPLVPLLVTAGLMDLGGLAYARTSAARRWQPSAEPSAEPSTGRRRRRAGPSVFAAGGVGAVLLVVLAMSVAFGQLDTSMAATAGVLLGGTQRVGILFASIAGGSAIGGLVFGSRHWVHDEGRAVTVLLGLFGVFLALMSLLMLRSHPSLWIVLPLLFVTGLTIAPTLIMQQNLLDHLSPPARRNEAQSLLSAANTTGAAAGTAAAGLLIDLQGTAASFGGAAAAAVIASVIALTSRRRWRAASAAVAAEPESESAGTATQPVP